MVNSILQIFYIFTDLFFCLNYKLLRMVSSNLQLWLWIYLFFSFISINVCFLHLEYILFSAYEFRIVISSCWVEPFIDIKYPLTLVMFFAINSTFSGINIAKTIFLLLVSAWCGRQNSKLVPRFPAPGIQVVPSYSVKH